MMTLNLCGSNFITTEYYYIPRIDDNNGEIDNEVEEKNNEGKLLEK